METLAAVVKVWPLFSLISHKCYGIGPDTTILI